MSTQRRPSSVHVTSFHFQSHRSISSQLFSSPKTKDGKFQDDLNHAMHLVQSHDPAGYLPGRLLPTRSMQVAYYAVRSFWVETGLRFGSTAMVPPNSTPAQHLEWWMQGIELLYTSRNEPGSELPSDYHHPTLRLLKYLMEQENIQFTKCHFDDILKGRRRDLDLKQYPDLASLEEHAVWSCGSLAQLVLESQGLMEHTNALKAHEAARLVGTCHGLTNALRTSIPVVSTTGKLIIPHDLCVKYGVKSPRYLLSALGQGDANCIQALRNAVRDIVESARDHLQRARNLRPEIVNEPGGREAVAVLLPGLASEAFLNRLEQLNFDLTNRDLRHVNFLEHTKCSCRMILAAYQGKY